ncbi:MAG: hypothetical protein ACRDD2_02785 [Sarcina sp.]
MNEEGLMIEEEFIKNTIVREEVLKRKARVNQLKMKNRIRRRRMGAIHMGRR